jgi:hypothetical protein
MVQMKAFQNKLGLVLLGALAILRKATIRFMSVRRSALNNSAPTTRIFMKFDIWVFFENLLREFSFHQNLKRTAGTLHEDRCTVLVICRSFLLTIKMFQKKVVEKILTHILRSITIFSKIVPFMR